MNTQITEALARRVLEVVDAGLVCGLGVPVPGRMCVEAAVCYVLGLPHSANPPCVHPAVRSAKIRLNDLPGWLSPEARARGMRRLAIAQLGTADVGDWSGFGAAAQRRHDAYWAAIKPHRDAYEAAIRPRRDAYRATYGAALLPEIERYAEDLVQLLVAGGAPGAAFLYLTEQPK